MGSEIFVPQYPTTTNRRILPRQHTIFTPLLCISWIAPLVFHHYLLANISGSRSILLTFVYFILIHEFETIQLLQSKASFDARLKLYTHIYTTIIYVWMDEYKGVCYYNHFLEALRTRCLCQIVHITNVLKLFKRCKFPAFDACQQLPTQRPTTSPSRGHNKR